jgi:shikimate kinase
VVHLAGPGGAGKSTVGPPLAERLGVPFFDLDRLFERRFGNISAFITLRGYHEYVRHNVETYRALVARAPADGVVALSSGFMTYAADEIRGSSTFVLLPSLDRERCVAETVRRQLARPFARSREREERVIRERFEIYMSLPWRKIETMRSTSAIVEDLVDLLASPVNYVRHEPFDDDKTHLHVDLKNWPSHTLSKQSRDEIRAVAAQRFENPGTRITYRVLTSAAYLCVAIADPELRAAAAALVDNPKALESRGATDPRDMDFYSDLVKQALAKRFPTPSP